MKKCCIMAAVLCALLSLSGCVSFFAQKVVFDESIPPEQSTVVVFGSSIHVVEYNGIDVEDSWYRKGLYYRQNTVTLPAGETTILVNYYFSFRRGNIEYTATGEGLELTFDFEAGKNYTVTTYTKKEGFLFSRTEYGVAIWDHAPAAIPGNVDNSVKSWRLGKI